MCVESDVCVCVSYWVTFSGPEERQVSDLPRLRLHSHSFELLATPTAVEVPDLAHLVSRNSINKFVS